jgi:hypothetical protein
MKNEGFFDYRKVVVVHYYLIKKNKLENIVKEFVK